MNFLPPNRKTKRYSSDDLVEIGVHAIRRVLASLKKQLNVDAEAALEPIEMKRSGKKALHIDKQAEMSLKQTICGNKRFSEIEFYGEERLGIGEIDLSHTDRTCVLADALDGTDLFERDLANWCSAVVFFTPLNEPGQRIQVALVGLPNGSIYFATHDDDGVSVQREGEKNPTTVRGVDDKRQLEEASICFYGQKVKNLSAFLESGFMDWVAQADRKRKDATKALRIYNLAGIPMMVKMIDPSYLCAAGIDVVFEPSGQQAHDVVAGAFLALKHGAVMLSPDGKPMGIKDLEDALMHPNHTRMEYVIARNATLAEQMVAALGHKARKSPSR